MSSNPRITRNAAVRTSCAGKTQKPGSIVRIDKNRSIHRVGFDANMPKRGRANATRTTALSVLPIGVTTTAMNARTIMIRTASVPGLRRLAKNCCFLSIILQLYFNIKYINIKIIAYIMNIVKVTFGGYKAHRARLSPDPVLGEVGFRPRRAFLA